MKRRFKTIVKSVSAGAVALGIVFAGYSVDLSLNDTTRAEDSPIIANSDPVWPDSDPVWPDSPPIVNSDPVWPDDEPRTV